VHVMRLLCDQPCLHLVPVAVLLLCKCDKQLFGCLRVSGRLRHLRGVVKRLPSVLM
jgi:hypothetical protein